MLRRRYPPNANPRGRCSWDTRRDSDIHRPQTRNTLAYRAGHPAGRELDAQQGCEQSYTTSEGSHESPLRCGPLEWSCVRRCIRRGRRLGLYGDSGDDALSMEEGPQRRPCLYRARPSGHRVRSVRRDVEGMDGALPHLRRPDLSKMQPLLLPCRPRNRRVLQLFPPEAHQSVPLWGDRLRRLHLAVASRPPLTEPPAAGN